MQLPKLNCQQLDAIVEALIGMPCFIILAKDAAAVPALLDYKEQANKIGARNIVRTTARTREIEQWQKDHPEQVKVPD